MALQTPARLPARPRAESSREKADHPCVQGPGKGLRGTAAHREVALGGPWARTAADHEQVPILDSFWLHQDTP